MKTFLGAFFGVVVAIMVMSIVSKKNVEEREADPTPMPVSITPAPIEKILARQDVSATPIPEQIATPYPLIVQSTPKPDRFAGWGTSLGKPSVPGHTSLDRDPAEKDHVLKHFHLAGHVIQSFSEGLIVDCGSGKVGQYYVKGIVLLRGANQAPNTAVNKPGVVEDGEFRYTTFDGAPMIIPAYRIVIEPHP